MWNDLDSMSHYDDTLHYNNTDELIDATDNSGYNVN